MADEFDIEELLKGIDNGISSNDTSDSDNSTVRDSTSERSGSSSGRELEEQEGQGTAGSIQEEVRGLTVDVTTGEILSKDTSYSSVPTKAEEEINVGHTDNTGSDNHTAVHLIPYPSEDSTGTSPDTIGNANNRETSKSTTTETSTKNTEHGTINTTGEEYSGDSEASTSDRSKAEQDEQETRQALPELPKGITEDTIERVVSSAWLSHTLEGSVNVEFISNNLPKNVYLPKGWTLGKVLLLPHVAEKLEARGVPKPTDADILTPKQIQALVVITNARNMKWAARLKQAGVTVAEWQSWLKQPNFRMVYDKYAEGRLRDAIPEGISALSDKAADGDLNAVKLVLEMTGRHDPNGGKEVNIQAILVGIVEILQQEVSDMEVLMRVVNRIKGLQTGIGIGTGNIKGEIE